MADEQQPPLYVRDVTGTPAKVSPERFATGKFQDRPLASEQSADEAVSDMYAQDVANQTYGDAGQFGMGFFNEGLGLGLPGAAYIKTAELLGQQREADEVRRLLRGSQQLGTYQAGGIAGLIAPMFLGEAGGGGPLGLGGTLTERLASRLLPESAGLLGSVSKTGLRLAARGATEGAMIGLAQQLQQSVIRNVPLTAEALLVSGGEGALLGGIAGGVLGGTGALLGKGVEAAGAGLAGKGERGLARQLQRLGLTTDEIAAIAERESGNTSNWLRRARTQLGEAGESWTSKTGRIAEVAEEKAQQWSILRKTTLETLDKEASTLAPDALRVRERMTTEFLARFEGTPEWKRANKVVRSFINDILGEEHRIGRKLGKAAKSPINDFLGGGESAANDNLYRTPWSKWAQIEDQLSSKYDRIIGKIHDPDAVRVINRDTLVQMRDVIRDEMRSAMESAALANPELRGIAEQYGAQTLNKVTMEELAAAAGRKHAAEFASGKGATWTAPDIAQAAGIAAIGHGGSAVGLLAGKGLIRRAGGFMEPYLAEMAWKNMAGAEAGVSTSTIQNRIKGSVKKFFNAAGRASVGGYTASKTQARARAQYNDRNAFEANLEQTRSLLSEHHRQRVEQYAQFQSDLIHPALGPEILDRYQKAAQYLQMNIPPGRAAVEANSLRRQPKVKGMDLKEFKYMRINEAIKNPLSILEGLENGNVSRDAVRAVKYVYPELHAEIVQETTRQIWEMKSQGKYLPMDKVAHLGIVLDAPVDSILEQSRISSIQASFVTPEQPQPQPPPEQAFSAMNLQTPVESLA